MKIFFLTGYLIVLASIGIISAMRIKSSDDFYTAGKNNGSLGVAGSLLATILGSSAILGTVNLGASRGWASAWIMLSAAIGLFALYPIAGRVKRFGHYTLPELLESFYGKEAKVISSILIPAAWVGIIAAQIIGAAKILTAFFGFQYITGVLLCGSVFILYTAIGGQISIIKTDLFQSMLIITGVIITAAFAYNAANVSIIKISAPSFPFNNSFSLFDLIVLLLTYSTTYTVGPDIYSRLFCSKDEETAKRAILITGIVLIPIAFILAFLGVYSASFFTADTNSGSLLIQTILSLLPDWGIGIMIAALLSAVMSSADTTLLTASTILSDTIRSGLEKESSIKTTRIIIPVIGALSILFALKVTSIIASLLTALTIFSGAFIIPVLAGLGGFRAGKKQAGMAIISGGLLALAGKIIIMSGYKTEGNMIIIAAFALNAAILFFPFGNNKR